MFILDQKEYRLINTEYIVNIYSEESKFRPGDWVIIAKISNTGISKEESNREWLGIYKRKEAQGILQSLCDAMQNGEAYFRMPLSEAIAPENYIHDARVKRKGGS